MTHPYRRDVVRVPGAPSPAAMAMGRIWRSGSRYGPAAYGIGTGAPLLNELRWVPVFVPNAVTITEIACEVTTAGAAGAVTRLGIASDTQGRPDQVLFQTAGLASTVIGKVSATVSWALAAGRYYFGACPQVALPQYRTISSVAEMIEQPSIPSFLRAGFSVYGQTGVLIGGGSPDSNDAVRVEVLVA